METIKDMAIKMIGEIPESALWIQDIVIIFLIITIISVFLIPIALIIRKVGR